MSAGTPRTGGEITRLLGAYRDGDGDAMEQLVELVYDDLRRLAKGRRRRGGTLDTHALVHEAFLKLAQAEPAWSDREHFFAVAARAMRQICVDYARHRGRDKRGGGQGPIPLDEVKEPAVESEIEGVLVVDALLRRLEGEEPRLARVVECRKFAGLSEGETAAALGVSLRTVQRDWMRARRLLRQELAGQSTE